MTETTYICDCCLARAPAWVGQSPLGWISRWMRSHTGTEDQTLRDYCTDCHGCACGPPAVCARRAPGGGQ